MRYSLSNNGVFRSLQGEGSLLGLPMIFVRLAGCSVGCPQCDTDYAVHERLDVDVLRDRISQLLYGGVAWLWVTGGEPTDHNLVPLIDAARTLGLRVALATAGTRKVQQGFVWGGVDFLSVSPHRLDDSWVQRSGSQINLVPGLNGLRLADADPVIDEINASFSHRFVTPLANGSNVQECIAWVQSHRGWRLSIQAHKHWNLP